MRVCCGRDNLVSVMGFVAHVLLLSLDCVALNFIQHVSCRHGFIDNLQLGGPTPIGARKAPLSEKYLSMMQEVALNEQVCLP